MKREWAATKKRYSIEAKKKAALVWATCLWLLLRVAAAQAVTPTPTNTPTPAPFITPTSQYKGLRPTPTDIVLGSTTAVPFNFSRGELADSMISGYRMMNLGGAIDLIFFIILVVIVVSILFDLADEARGD